MKVTYQSNSSGGKWWLNDADWRALEDAGWTLNPLYRPDKDGRWLGAIATSCWKEFDSLDEAVEEWERITGEYARDRGCSCCGEPHWFSAETEDGETLNYD